MPMIFLALLLIASFAHAQPASLGFLTYKQSTLTLFTPASSEDIKTITTQELGGKGACCFSFAWQGVTKTTVSETVTSESVPVYAYEIPLPPAFKVKDGYVGQVLLNVKRVTAKKLTLQGQDHRKQTFSVERCLSREGIHLFPRNASRIPRIYFHVDYEIDLNEIGSKEQACP